MVCGFFLVPAYPGCPGKAAVKRVCLSVCLSRRSHFKIGRVHIPRVLHEGKVDIPRVLHEGKVDIPRVVHEGKVDIPRVLHEGKV